LVPGATRKKARRTRSPHSGVVLEPPEGEHTTWRARYLDPDTGRRVRVRIDPLTHGSAEARRVWAIALAKKIAKRRMDLESGAPRETGTTLADAIDRYYKAHTRLRDKTLKGYRAATAKLLAWATKAGIHSADDLTRARLLDFRERLVNEPKHVAARGAKRGQRKATAKPRSALSVNRELRAVRGVLGYLAELDLLPKIREGDLRRALKRLEVDEDAVVFLPPADIRTLIDAALKHDTECFAMTREEHAAGRAGETTRYAAIAPMIVTLLLSGMRLGEAVALEWRQVDLEALGESGTPVGEIRLTSATKTRRARTIDLSVSPALRELLEALRPERASGRVFPALTYDSVGSTTKRLRTEYEAPEAFSPQVLRSTCASFLTNSPGIYGGASAYRSARQLGHSVSVAEKSYLGVVRGIPASAKTLEAAMQIETHVQRVIDAV
jgi:integrase